MFDVSFSELMVIAIVALVVVGPERLPKVARTAGLLFGRLQRYVNDVKSDISREIQLDELKRLQSEMQESARSFERSMNEGILSIEQSVGQTVGEAQSELQAISSSVSAGDAAGPEALDAGVGAPPMEPAPAASVVPSEPLPKA